MTDFMIEGQDISNIQLTAQALPTISGRIVFEGRQLPQQLKPYRMTFP